MIEDRFGDSLPSMEELAAILREEPFCRAFRPEKEAAYPPPASFSSAPPLPASTAVTNPFDFPHSAAIPSLRQPVSRVRRLLWALEDLLFFWLCVTLVSGAVLFTASREPGKSFLGYTIFIAKTQSMAPAQDGSSLPGGFSQGAAILAQRCLPEEIEINDVITFNADAANKSAAYLTERVVEIKEELDGKLGLFFVTKGDASLQESRSISGKQLVGRKIASVPLLGTLLQRMCERPVPSYAMLACFFAVLVLLRFFSLHKRKGY
ncbi:MAG: hypothetical protein LBQ33_01130 [Oscillospiraceae bacterium]|nr:hypothetical protein [Oscillospiraceae bacterium]